MSSIKKPPAVMSDKVRRELSHPEKYSNLALSAASKPPYVSSLSAALPSGDGNEISLGTVASPQVERAATPRLADLLAERKGESASAVSPDALKGIPLSDREREDMAAGLTPAMARRASEARVAALEWLLGLERTTQEQAERVASFRRMDAALIRARGKKPYLDSLGIPRLPPDCEPKYRHWEGGQPLLDTLLELGAADAMIDCRVTRERSLDDWRRWQEIKAQRVL